MKYHCKVCGKKLNVWGMLRGYLNLGDDFGSMGPLCVSCADKIRKKNFSIREFIIGAIVVTLLGMAVVVYCNH